MPMERTVDPHMDIVKNTYVFDTTTNFGFTAVILFLFLGQGLVAVAFFADFITDLLV